MDRHQALRDNDEEDSYDDSSNDDANMLAALSPAAALQQSKNKNKNKNKVDSSAYIRIVPVMFIYYMSIFMIMPLGAQIIIQLVCDKYNGGDDCASSHVSSIASLISLYAALASNIPALLLSGPYGSLVDKFGRKLAILIPQIGLAFNVAIYYYIAVVKPVNIYVYLLIAANLIAGFSGGGGVLQMGIFTYASDITEDDLGSRTKIFTVIESTLFFAKIGGPPIGGLWAQRRGIEEPLKFVMIFLAITSLWTFFGIKESLSVDDPVRKNEVTFNPFKTFKNLLQICRMRMDKGSNPVPYVLLGYFITLSVVIGNLSVIVYYVSYKFQWNAEDVGYYFALEGGVQTFSMIFLPLVIERLFRCKPDNIYYISVGYLFRGMSYLAIGLCTTATQIYLCAIIFLFTGPYYPRNRVLLSNSVTSANQATMQSAIAAVDNLASFASPIFTLIYSQTVNESPSIVYYVLATLTFVACLLCFYTTVTPSLFRNLPEAKERERIRGNGGVGGGDVKVAFSVNDPLIRPTHVEEDVYRNDDSVR